MTRRALLVAAAVAATAMVGALVGIHLASRPAAPVRAAAAALRFNLWSEPRPLPALRFVDERGSTLSLADFRGKVVLLNVWATWCTPCQEEMPALDRLDARLGGPRFKVLALSIDGLGAEVVRDFYDLLELRSLGVYVDATGRAMSELGAVGIPLTLLVDGEGRELGRLAGARKWDGDDAVALVESHLGPPGGAR
jgi:thiol-disulfide isomerase/thioredoxin